MKKLNILSLWILCLSLLTHIAQAQLSVGLGGTYTRYIGGNNSVYTAQNFPIIDTELMPTIVGGKLLGSYGFLEQNVVRFGVGYNMGLGNLPVDGTFMFLATGKISSIEASIDYQRYLLGSYNGGGGLYAFGGFSFLNTNLTFDIPNPTGLAATGEAKFFNDRLIQLITFNAGLGAEILAFDKFYLFAEGNLGIHTNAYVDNTTIKQSNLMYLFRAMAGVRIPFGGTSNKKYPKRKRF